MKYWKLLGLGSEPKGTGKIMSICMFIVIINGYFLEGLIEHMIIDIITYTCVIVFFLLLMYNLLKNPAIQLDFFILKGKIITLPWWFILIIRLTLPLKLFLHQLSRKNKSSTRQSNSFESFKHNNIEG